MGPDQQTPARVRRTGALRPALGPRALAACALAAAALTLAAAEAAPAAMKSQRIAPGLCETTGGGRFVPIPGAPGEMIDRRLLRDVRMLQRRYKILITDGYSLDRVHARKGEHPIGLALDIVPDRSRGGTWRLITQLARWAEPNQDQPRAPFRWVGYDGDPGHGRGHHLHLSWSHSPTRYNRPARTVYTMRCPAPQGRRPTGGERRKRRKGSHRSAKKGKASGSVKAGSLLLSGGLRAPLAPPQPERGGVSRP